MNMIEYAKREMDLAWPELEPMQDMIKKDVLAIVKLFSDQGHSGMSGAYTLNLLERLFRFKPIKPLTGADDEWKTPDGPDNMQQNIRCSSVFRKNFDNETACDIDGKVFSEDGGETFYSCRESSVPVTFPYVPPTSPERIILK